MPESGVPVPTPKRRRLQQLRPRRFLPRIRCGLGQLRGQYWPRARWPRVSTVNECHYTRLQQDALALSCRSSGPAAQLCLQGARPPPTQAPALQASLPADPRPVRTGAWPGLPEPQHPLLTLRRPCRPGKASLYRRGGSAHPPRRRGGPRVPRSGHTVTLVPGPASGRET